MQQDNRLTGGTAGDVPEWDFAMIAKGRLSNGLNRYETVVRDLGKLLKGVGCLYRWEIVMQLQANAEYKYRRIGLSKWANDSWTGHVRRKSEAAVVQEILKKHPNSEIELVELRWD